MPITFQSPYDIARDMTCHSGLVTFQVAFLYQTEDSTQSEGLGDWAVYIYEQWGHLWKITGIIWLFGFYDSDDSST